MRAWHTVYYNSTAVPGYDVLLGSLLVNLEHLQRTIASTRVGRRSKFLKVAAAWRTITESLPQRTDQNVTASADSSLSNAAACARNEGP